MAFENYPEAEQSNIKIPTPLVQEKKMGKTLLTAGLIIALLGTWGYIIYDKNKVKEVIEQKDTVIATTFSQREQLQNELNDAAMRYDELKTGNAQKDSAILAKNGVIAAKDRDIAEKRTKIQQLLSKQNATKEELAEAKRLIQSLNGDIDGYKNEILVLTEQKTKLISEKAVAVQQRDTYRRNYDSTNLVVKQKETLIDIGSTLHASNFNIVGINEKNSGKEKITSVSKRVDKFRVSFDLDENMITESGIKELYICVTAPDGNPLSAQAVGSGTFNIRTGQEIPYTKKLEVNYTQNKRQTVSFEWKPSANFPKGNYKIEVYNNGFKVGEGYKDLRKGGLFS